MKKQVYGHWNEFPKEWTDVRRRYWAIYWKNQFQGLSASFGVVAIVFIFVGPYLPKALVIAGFVIIGTFCLFTLIKYIFEKIEDSTY